MIEMIIFANTFKNCSADAYNTENNNNNDDNIINYIIYITN